VRKEDDTRPVLQFFAYVPVMVTLQVTNVPDRVSEVIRDSLTVAVPPLASSVHVSDVTPIERETLLVVSSTEHDVRVTLAVESATEACAAHGSALFAGAVTVVDELWVQVTVSAYCVVCGADVTDPSVHCVTCVTDPVHVPTNAVTPPPESTSGLPAPLAPPLDAPLAPAPLPLAPPLPPPLLAPLPPAPEPPAPLLDPPSPPVR
jgi:hypothetical protein